MDERQNKTSVCCYTVWFANILCVCVLHRSGGFLSKILKKRPHKEAQTPDNGELTLAQILNERPAGGEGKEQNKIVLQKSVTLPGLDRLRHWLAANRDSIL